jgi:predicted DNA-binding transcriptional regulator AlpA
MIPANSSVTNCTVKDLAEKYDIPRPSVVSWVQREDFPPSVGAARKAMLYDEDKVDAWLRRHQPGIWVRAHSGPNPFGLPEGREEDLLTLEEIGRLHGTVVLQRDPTPVATLRTYISKNYLGKADRAPEDGLSPTVTGPRWYRSTAYAFLNTPRRSNRGTSLEADVRAERPAEIVVLPDGDDLDLLGIEEIRTIDTAVRGRPSPSVASLRQYMGTGRFPRPDRTPGDGREPEVHEPKWVRRNAYGFIRRPQVGKPRKS